jgi:hypothetical protein
VFPNPSLNGKIHLKTNFHLREAGFLVITNSLGIPVYSSQLPGNEFFVDAGEWQTGIYFAEITTTQGTIKKRLVIQ